MGYSLGGSQYINTNANWASIAPIILRHTFANVPLGVTNVFRVKALLSGYESSYAYYALGRLRGIVTITGTPQITASIDDNPIILTAAVTQTNGPTPTDGSFNVNNFNWSIQPTGAGTLSKNSGTDTVNFNLTNASVGSFYINVELNNYPTFSRDERVFTSKAAYPPQTPPITYPRNVTLRYRSNGGTPLEVLPTSDNRTNSNYNQLGLTVTQNQGTTALATINPTSGYVILYPVDSGSSSTTNVFTVTYSDFNYAEYREDITVTVNQ